MYHGACKNGTFQKQRSFAVNKYYLFALCISMHAMNGMEKQHNWNAQKYSKNSELQCKAAMGALSRIEFNGDEKVLDIGCGDGRVTAEIAKRVPRGSVKGVDISENMIEHACTTHQQDNLSFDILDISNIKYPYATIGSHGFHDRFNVITAFSSLSWIPYEAQKEAFKNIALLLAYKGKVRAGLAHKDSAYLRARTTMLTHDRWKQYFEGYEIPYYPSDEQEVRGWLQQAFLKEELVAKIEAPHTFTCRQEFIDWMSAIPVQIDRIPQEQHQQFFNDIVDEYLKEVPQAEDGSIKLSIAALAVRAESVSNCW
jgi:trans-aconitate methyltransferase